MTDYTLLLFGRLYRMNIELERGIDTTQSVMRRLLLQFGPYTLTNEGWFK